MRLLYLPINEWSIFLGDFFRCNIHFVPWIRIGMDLVYPFFRDHATIRAKICSCSIALASLVSSSLRCLGPAGVTTDVSQKQQRQYTTKGMFAPINKQTNKQRNKQRKNQNCWLYRSYHLTFVISKNPVLPRLCSWIMLQPSSTHGFSPLLRSTVQLVV